MHAIVLSLLLSGQTDSPDFSVVSPADERPTGELLRLTAGLTATLRTKSGEQTVTDAISLRRADRIVPHFPTGAHLLTTSGDRIAGAAVGGDGQFLRFRPSGVALKRDQDWKLPLSSVVVLWLTDVPANTPHVASDYDWLTEVENQDVLRFRNGDTARGTIGGFDPEVATPTLSFRPSRGETRSVAAKELAAVAFNPSLARSRKPKGVYARVVLTDGSRLSLTDPAVANGVLSGSALFGQKVQVRLAEVVAIDHLGGKAEYLSDLKPKKVEQAGFLGVTWPWAADRSVRGQPLSVKTRHGESIADKGLGTHPRTTLAYDLGGKYQRFEALVGLDPDVAVRSKVAVRVLVDGKEQSIPGLRAVSDGTAVEVRVDVRGAKELVLETDYGPAGGIGGDVNWADARLVK